MRERVQSQMKTPENQRQRLPFICILRIRRGGAGHGPRSSSPVQCPVISQRAQAKPFKAATEQWQGHSVVLALWALVGLDLVARVWELRLKCKRKWKLKLKLLLAFGLLTCTVVGKQGLRCLNSVFTNFLSIKNIYLKVI